MQWDASKCRGVEFSADRLSLERKGPGSGWAVLALPPRDPHRASTASCVLHHWGVGRCVLALAPRSLEPTTDLSSWPRSFGLALAEDDGEDWAEQLSGARKSTVMVEITRAAHGSEAPTVLSLTVLDPVRGNAVAGALQFGGTHEEDTLVCELSDGWGMALAERFVPQSSSKSAQKS
jgi:hypothetical protein